MKNIYKYCCLIILTSVMTTSLHAQTELVVDGGFETGPGGSAWTQASTNFGTPLCDLASCGTGTGTGPRTGGFWAWFGGIPNTVETGSVSQSFVIPSGGTAILTFWLEQIVCDGPQDFLEVQIDGNIIFTSDGASPLCGVLGYSEQTIDISSYADGNSHTLLFTSTTISANGGNTNFFVDDVSVIHSTGGGTGCPNIIVDGNFEQGVAGSGWTNSSTSFGTPICDVASCGTGTGTGPNGGSFWTWFGGLPGGVETGIISQSLVFPAGDSITLNFYLEQIICDGPQDFVEVDVDGTVVFQTDGASPLCGVLGYTLQSVDLSAFADGNSHTITFSSTTFSANGGVTNFFIDDVTVISCPNTPVGTACADTVAFIGVNVAIPDDDPAGVTNSQVVSGVPGTTLGTDVKLSQVCFKINHTWVGDLIVSLTAPNSTNIVLLDRPGVPATLAGCDGDNIDVCVELGVGNEMENVCNNLPAIAGTFTAANGTNLNAINMAGGSPNGTWALFASDNVGADIGTIVDWQLIFNVGPAASWTAPAELCDNSGVLDLNTLVTGTAGGTWSGTGVTGSNFNPTGLSGPVSITYTVVDLAGCSDSETNTINIVSGAPVASFTSTPVSLTVTFTNTSTGGGTYLWDFGDGNTSTDMNPSHTYATAQTYTVTLTVTNICGTNSTTQQVTVVGCPDIIIDGSFEIGGTWIEFSSTFGTPVCDLASCGNGTGTGPRTGANWSWFGGIAAFEEGSMKQTFTIPTNSTATLSFWLEQIVCDGPDDFLKVAIDADTVYTTTGTSPLCGVLGYSLQTVNLDAYADGVQHELTFFSRIYGTNGNGTNFFVDDVSLNVCTGIGISETLLNQSVSVMPVPARDFFEVKFKNIYATNVSIEITDIIGKTIHTSVVPAINENLTERFDVSSWSKGVYTVKVTTSGNSVFRKIVIQ